MSRPAPSAICSISTSANERTTRLPSRTSTVSWTTSAAGFAARRSRAERAAACGDRRRLQLGSRARRRSAGRVSSSGISESSACHSSSSRSPSCRELQLPQVTAVLGAAAERHAVAREPLIGRVVVHRPQMLGRGLERQRGQLEAEPTDSLSSRSSVSFTERLLGLGSAGEAIPLIEAANEWDDDLTFRRPAASITMRDEHDTEL